MKNIRLIFIYLITLILFSCTDIKFDSNEWKNWEEKSENYAMRWDMSNDLIKNYDLIGMSKNEVIELLGTNVNDYIISNCDLIYDLGPCRSGISYGSLYLTFSQNKVIKIFKHCG